MTEASHHDPTIDPAEFRRVLGHFPTGVTVVTSGSSSAPIGVAIGSFASISLDPPLVGFFLGNSSASGTAIKETEAFCVNVLNEDQLELCGLMASKADDKFSGVSWIPSPSTGCPVLPGVHAVIDCRVEQIVPLGDHDLIVGRVEHLDTVEGEANPMVFHKGRYGTFGLTLVAPAWAMLPDWSSHPCDDRGSRACMGPATHHRRMGGCTSKPTDALVSSA